MARRVIYYDTETTGIKASKERIVEIAAYDPQRNSSFVELVNPQMAIPEEASRVHGISDEMVSQADPFVRVAERFMDFCSGEVWLVAHNNDAFDQPFLEAEFNRNGLLIPSQWNFFDSLIWARRYRPDLPRHALQFLREVYGIAANQAHRALDDVVILHQVFTYMLDDLSLEQAAELMKHKKTLRTMPFGKHRGKPFAQVPKSYFQWLASEGALDKPENAELKECLRQLGLVS